MINSPLNYTGNKFKLLQQIIPYLDGESESFVDIFGGSGLVALNTQYKKVLINDNNPVTIELLNYFKDNSAKHIFRDIDTIIEEYGFTDSHRNGLRGYTEERHEGLSRYNKEPFNRLKADYNNSPTIEKLFALIIFGFNHYIRYNSKGLFNVPVGKVDYSTSLRKKTEEYALALKSKDITITNLDFKDESLYTNEKALYYFDPPYLITQAPYNMSWHDSDDLDLFKLLDSLNDRGIKFALSNVISSNGKENTVLKEWSKKYNTFHLDRKYLNSNYRKKNITIAQEVLICNYNKERNK